MEGRGREGLRRGGEEGISHICSAEALFDAVWYHAKIDSKQSEKLQ